MGERGQRPRKPEMKANLKPIAIAIASITAGATLYSCLAIGIGFYQAIAPRPFDPVKWQAIALGEDDRRYPMVDDLLESGILLNRTRREVLGLLGQPSATLQEAMRSPQWRYRLGTGFGTVGVKHKWLVVEFGDHNTVTQAIVIRE